MRATSRRTGAHRKPTPTVGSKVALAAVATGTITTAGAAGAAVASADAATVAPTDNVQLAADTAPLPLPQIPNLGTPPALPALPALPNAPELPQMPSIAPEDIAPQILTIAELKPVADLAEQVQKAIDYHADRVAEDMASRAPAVVRPAQGVLTSGYGSRWGAVHRGIDIANSLGTPIVAAEDGVVISAGPASGFGQWVRVRHDDGTVTVYGHMETIDVSVGQHVTAGQKLAGMGSRGFSTGVHLHFEVHPNGGGAIDPIPWLAARGVHL